MELQTGNSEIHSNFGWSDIKNFFTPASSTGTTNSGNASAVIAASAVAAIAWANVAAKNAGDAVTKNAALAVANAAKITAADLQQINSMIKSGTAVIGMVPPTPLQNVRKGADGISSNFGGINAIIQDVANAAAGN